MSKKGKRSKKFLSKGGVKAGLSKGTITKRGKLKNRKSNSVDGPQRPGLEDEKRRIDDIEVKNKTREEKDFCGKKNLGELDMDSFFAEVSNVLDASEDKGDKEGIEVKETKEEEEEGTEDLEDDSSVNDDSSMEEDLEEAEENMRKEMERMQAKDPEFHKFLEHNEKSLLEFGDDDDVDADDIETIHVDKDEEEKKEVNEDEDLKMKEGKKSEMVMLTSSVLNKYIKSAFDSHGIKGVRRIVAAYRSACHLNDVADQGDGEGKNKVWMRYQFGDAVVFDRLMMVTLTRCHEEFYYHLCGEGAAAKEKKKKDKSKNPSSDEDSSSPAVPNQFDPNTPINPRHLEKSQRFKVMSKIIHMFFRSTIHILSTSAQPQLIIILMNNLVNYIPLVALYPLLATRLLKTLTQHWISTSQSDHTLQLKAFLLIRQLSLTQPFPFLETSLKTAYLAFAKNSKFTSEITLPTLTFRGNCLVELYSLDIDSSYQHAFIYIRQLALLLRTALQKKTKESFATVYSWQYMNCLKAWSAIVAANPAENELRSLIYPLVEVIMSVVRLLPTHRFLPLRLHCVRFLQQLAASAETFIPTTFILLDILDISLIHKKPKIDKRKTAKGIRIPLILKLPKEDTMKTSEQIEAVVSECFVLLTREIDLYRYSTGFVEFGMRICTKLREFNKLSRNTRWKAFSNGCIETAEKHSQFCMKARAEILQTPKQATRLEFLKPEGEMNMKERYAAFISKEKKLENAAQDVIAPTKKAESKKMDGTQSKKKRKMPKEDSVSESSKPNRKELKAGDASIADEVVEGIDWSDSEDV